MSRSDRAPAALGGAGGLLTIDLDALAGNYRRLAERARAGGAACGAVVKADGYGLGLDRVAPTLAAAGCRSFFVALLEEGLALRRLVPGADIAVFNGVDAETAPAMAEAGLRPVLNHFGQIADWDAEARRRGKALPAVLHVDTGMNRLGLGAADTAALAEDPGRLDGIEVETVMSHLACADEAEHELTAVQLGRFRDALAKLRPVGFARASLANSAGLFHGPDYAFDLARPGSALYGVSPVPEGPNPMVQVIRLQGKILQTRVIDTPETVGYGATHRAAPGTRIATVGVGYGDGYLRSLGGVASAHVGDIRVAVVGRVSMDLITIDVTAVPEHECGPGTLVDLIGPHHSVDDIAREAGTIGYEILTALGRRYARRYTGGPPA